MKLVNHKFAITIVNNDQIGGILQAGAIGGLPLDDAKGFISISESNPN